MSALVDIHGNRYHTAMWHAEARTASEDKSLCAAAFARDPNGTIKTRMVILSEAGELVTTPLDMGSYLYVPQDNGTWQVTYVTADRQNETRALDAK